MSIREINSQYDPKKLEEKIRKFWENKNIPEKVAQFKMGRKKFYLLDGPPYANQVAHVGHIKTRVLKDVWVKLKAMQGFNVWLQPGFDCHGLPIENIVERELKIKSKKDIEEMGVDKFIELCREKALGNEQKWLEMYRILGDWRGWHQPYMTLENYYIESGWWTVKQLFKRGMLVQGEKSTFWCPHCVDKNAKVLTSNGVLKRMKELENCWTHHSVIGFNEKNNELAIGTIKKYFKNRKEQVAKLSTSETGRWIIASFDHPFWVKGRGWVQLKNIVPGDKVAVFPHVEVEEENVPERTIIEEDDIEKFVTSLELKMGRKRIGNTVVRYADLVCIDKKTIDDKIRKLKGMGCTKKEIQKEIFVEEKVKVSISTIQNVNKIKRKNRILEYVIKELKNKKLLPLTTKNPQLSILARLVGHIFGGGSLFFTGKKRVNVVVVFTGDKNDLQTISHDLKELGFSDENIKTVLVKSVVNGNGYTTQLRTNSISLIALLATLGVPIGDKTKNSFEVPKWVFNSPKHIIREFLAAYFGSELERIKLRNRSFDTLKFYLHKDKAIVDSGINFVKQINRLLKKFGVKIVNIRKSSTYVRRDGTKTIKISAIFSSSDENLLNFCKRVGYRYCQECEHLAAYVREYLEIKKKWKRKEIDIRNKIHKLRKIGLDPKEISSQLRINLSYVERIYEKPESVIEDKFPSFNEWVKNSSIRKGLVWETVEKIEALDVREVRDLSVKNLHSFIVNGFVTHNCETALAGYEVTDSYAEVKDPYIYVKFPIKGKKNEYILIFTTTPWTLVSNVAIAVRPDKYYVRVKVGNDVLILAEERAESVLKELCNLEYEIQEKFLGKDIEGVKYLPVLETPVQQKLKAEANAHKIILSIPVLKSKSYKHALEMKDKAKEEEFFDFVTTDEGSGCVHTAPGHGPEDYYVGLHYNLPVVSPVDSEGKFTKEAGEFKGMFVKDADKLIAEKLEKKGLLLHFGWITHSYPLCWRCKSPLVYRLSKQWFFSVDTIKEKMIKANNAIRWLPKFGRERMHNWLIDVVDWCVSRQRYWGIPLPIWICEKCGKKEVIGSESELREKAIGKLPKKLDLHKHVVDNIKLVCSNCGSEMHRVPDIMDVWFDSGIAPWASLGYPYKTGAKELFDRLWPVDLIDESQDQIRGWFYSLLFCGIAAFDRPSYEAVAINGWVLDEKGAKMSKSLGNVVWANEALERLGADILRMYFCWEVAPWETQKFNFKTAEEIRRGMNILWNSYSFFTTYCTDANLSLEDKWLEGMSLEDKWLLSKLNSMIPKLEQYYENFEFHRAGRMLMDFVVNDLSRFYIKLIRDRVWIGESGKSKQAGLGTLYKTLVTLAKLIAPITPFISEEIYQNLVRSLNKDSEESVHLTEWPKQNKELIDKKLEKKMNVVKDLIEACYSARQSAGLKLRWPLKQMIVVSDAETIATVKELNRILKKMCNVNSIEAAKEEPKGNFVRAQLKNAIVLISKEFDEDEALMRELTRKIQAMRKKYGYNVKQSIALTLKSDEKTSELLRTRVEDVKKEVGAATLNIGKLVGKYKGKVEFEGKVIEICFS